MSNLELIIKHLRGKYITLDCNVFILLVIGNLGKNHIRKFKRTAIFLEEDFDLLIKLISQSKLIITPNVVTEASNLLESYSVQGQKLGLIGLKNIVENLDETYKASKELIELGSFEKYGLSDSSMENLCKNNVTVITVDFPLYGYLANKSCPVINFNHVRTDYTL